MTRKPFSLRSRRIALGAVSVALAVLAGDHAPAHFARDSAELAAARGATPLSLTGDDGSVVDITARHEGMSVEGTGIVIGSGGEILTNNHVIQGAERVRVSLPDGSRYAARVLGADAGEDVALLEAREGSGLAPATLGDSSTVAVGDPVRAIGNAGGDGGTPSVAKGKVTALNQTITAIDTASGSAEHLEGLIETDAQVVPGDSGGPLVNANGEVIGMDTAASQTRERQGARKGFAIPINAAMSVVRSIEASQAAAPSSSG